MVTAVISRIIGYKKLIHFNFGSSWPSGVREFNFFKSLWWTVARWWQKLIWHFGSVVPKNKLCFLFTTWVQSYCWNNCVWRWWQQGFEVYPTCIQSYWVDTVAGELLVPEAIIHPVVSALTWFIRYVYYWNLQFLNNVIIIKTKVLLPQT